MTHVKEKQTHTSSFGPVFSTAHMGSFCLYWFLPALPLGAVWQDICSPHSWEICFQRGPETKNRVSPITKTITASPPVNDTAVWPLAVGYRVWKFKIRARKHREQKHRNKNMCNFCTSRTYTLEVRNGSYINQEKNRITNHCIRGTDALWHGKMLRRGNEPKGKTHI